jgi:NADH:ubiquinone oxidoreductase subunit B-like Fe-S oxidoreductase
LKNKKLKDLLNFTAQSVEEMQKDENFEDWSAEDIFQLATEVALNEYSAKGTKQPVARVDSDRFAFCFNDSDNESEVIIIHGEGLFDD